MNLQCFPSQLLDLPVYYRSKVFKVYWKYSRYTGSIQGILEVFKVYWKYSKYTGSIQGILEVFKVYLEVFKVY